MIRYGSLTILSLAAAISASGPALGASRGDPGALLPVQPLPVDRGVSIAGIPVACTGVGETRQDPRWADYPVRVEFSDAQAKYLTDAQVVLIDAKGKALFRVSCAPPQGAAEAAGGKLRRPWSIAGQRRQAKKRAVQGSKQGPDPGGAGLS
jgi:hypothetical protein